MNDPLLQLYQDQLDALRVEARRFAERYALARELDLNEDGKSRDPSVERLLQGTAFLAARIEKRLADDFPELTESILSAINPMQTQPYPPVTIVQFSFPDDRPSGEEPVTVPCGTALECKHDIDEAYVRLGGDRSRRRPESVGWSGDTVTKVPAAATPAAVATATPARSPVAPASSVAETCEDGIETPANNYDPELDDISDNTELDADLDMGSWNSEHQRDAPR